MIIYPFPEEINTNKSLTVAAMRLQEVFKVWGYDFPFGFFQELVNLYHDAYRKTDVIRVHPRTIANRVRIYPAEDTHALTVAAEKYKRHYSVVYADLAHLRVYVLED